MPAANILETIGNTPHIRINRLLGRLVSRGLIERTKERLGFGQTIAVLAQRN